MTLLDEVEAIMSTAGYVLSRRPDQLIIEDECAIGFVTEYPTVSSLISGWTAAQEQFLRAHARRLRVATEKAWNVYSVFLSTDAPTEQESHLLAAIEEDFSATRKIARAGLGSRLDTEVALQPLLPLMNVAPLGDLDVIGAFAARLELGDKAEQSLLAGDSVEYIARLILDEE